MVPDNAKAIDVYAGKYHTISLQLQRGDVIAWWAVGNRNFGFGLFHAQNDDDNDYAIMDQVVPTFPWMPGPTVTPLDDSVKIDGLYKIWISNERSWWSTLSVQLRVEVNGRSENLTST
ncbi:unnamed protein product [Cylicostephanus goldi]|uniref:Ctg-1-like C-terminal domain-containing protein n=1 Tax=Cylicostephanus goldi TaxID=71465 RepID=A0A3P7MAF5_CYLGO|nr:unnamed protein product [Cylicostephanus goldi]